MIFEARDKKISSDFNQNVKSETKLLMKRPNIKIDNFQLYVILDNFQLYIANNNSQLLCYPVSLSNQLDMHSLNKNIVNPIISEYNSKIDLKSSR